MFSDRDISDKRAEMEATLQGADVFFGSLLFDYDQVCAELPVCTCFLQLKGYTSVPVHDPA